MIPSDIELANELAQEVLGRTVDELLPQTRKLLTLLHGWVKAECERQEIEQADFHFTRRQAREATGWGDTQLWTHLGRLVELEFLLPHRGRGKTVEYELLSQGEDAEGRLKLLGLINCERFQEAEVPSAMTANIRGPESKIRGEEAEYSGVIRGVFGPDSGGVRGLEVAPEDALDEALSPFDMPVSPKRSTFLPLTPVPSYMQAVP